MLNNLRKAITDDIPVIHKLISNAAKHHRVLPRSIKELSAVIDFFIVYETDGKIVGCCALEIYNPRMAEIRSLVVNDVYQSKGIGRILIETCIDKAKKEKIHQVLSVTDKVDFFRKCGFDTCLNKQYAMFYRP